MGKKKSGTYVCIQKGCKTKFSDVRQLQSHISTTGHCGGSCDGAVMQKCFRRTKAPKAAPSHNNYGVPQTPTVAQIPSYYLAPQAPTAAAPANLDMTLPVESSSPTHYPSLVEMNKMNEADTDSDSDDDGENVDDDENDDDDDNNDDDSNDGSNEIVKEYDDQTDSWKKVAQPCSKIENNEDENVTKNGPSDVSIQDPSLEQNLFNYFCGNPINEKTKRGYVLADTQNAKNFEESVLVGQLIGYTKNENQHQKQQNQQKEQKEEEQQQQQQQQQQQYQYQQQVYLNTHEPFCLVTVGVQGAGKSHTLATILEGCLIPFPENNINRLNKPMTTLVLHYDESSTSRCEVITFYFIIFRFYYASFNLILFCFI